MNIPDVASRAIRAGLLVTQPLRYRIDELTYRASDHSADLEQLRGAWTGQPALVVANGPSLNKTPLDRFTGVRSIGMNKIDLIFPRTTWRPDLIVCENNVVVKQHAPLMAQHGIPVHLSWKARFFVPRRLRGQFHYFLTRNTPAFSTDITAGLGTSATVTYVALQYAYFLGANPVILVGCDHSFTFTGAPGNYQTMKGADQNHFDPNYFAKGAVWGTPNLEESERGYRKAREAFAIGGRIVVDASIEGKLRVFDKVSIAEAVALCSGTGQPNVF